MPFLQSILHMRRKSDAPSNTQPSKESVEDVERRMALLNLKSQPFVGGFNPAVIGGEVPYGTHPARPPTSRSMATPQHRDPPPVPPKIPSMTVTSPTDGRGLSKTMEYAMSSSDLGVAGPSRPLADNRHRPPLDASLRPRSDPAAYTRPQADHVRAAAPLPLFRDADDQPSLSVPVKASSSRVSPSALQVPISHPRGRSASSPATSPSSVLPDKVTCSGTTKANRRCKRQIARSALTLDDSLWYCRQHEPEALKEKRIRLGNGDFDEYKSFIPEYLSPNAQANLRELMRTAMSAKEEDGYLYVYQILDIGNYDPDKRIFKVGRTIKPKQRAIQWSGSCPSTEKHIVYVHPPSEDKNAMSLIAVHLTPGLPGILSHRHETLVLQELKDLERYMQYLHPKFRDGTSDFTWEDLDQEVRDRPRPVRVPCADCGKVHREIFAFTRVMSGPLVGKELERIIIPIINRWANFLAIHAMKDE